MDKQQFIDELIKLNREHQESTAKISGFLDKADKFPSKYQSIYRAELEIQKMKDKKYPPEEIAKAKKRLEIAKNSYNEERNQNDYMLVEETKHREEIENKIQELEYEMSESFSEEPVSEMTMA